MIVFLTGYPFLDPVRPSFYPWIHPLEEIIMLTDGGHNFIDLYYFYNHGVYEIIKKPGGGVSIKYGSHNDLQLYLDMIECCLC